MLSMVNKLVNFFRLPVNRFFFRRKPEQIKSADSSASSEKKNKRSFQRFSIEFDVLVEFIENGVKTGEDRGNLRDVSGSGALFVPFRPEKYYIGQQLKTVIYLAGTSDVRACISSEATVVRKTENVADKKEWPTCVAVRFDRTFDFERMDGGDTGMDG